MDGRVPLIDFGIYGLQVEDRNSVSDSELQHLASNVFSALNGVGFCYIKNHGLSQRTIDQLFRVSKDFFTQSRETKDACTSPTGRFNGYQALEKERLTESRPGDLKETFNYTTCKDLLNIDWPSSVPSMESSFSEFFTECTHLAHRILDVMSLSLKLETRVIVTREKGRIDTGETHRLSSSGKNRDYFRSRHKSLGGQKSPGTLRSIYYPPQPDDGSIKAGQLRCGEHTDYGTLALLFQDTVGGLEILTSEGQFVPVPPIEGTIVVNIGDLMERWTGCQLKATVHRVVIPEVELKRKQCRQSAVLFVDPDDNVIIECLDGSNKYEPVSSNDFVLGRIKKTYEN